MNQVYGQDYWQDQIDEIMDYFLFERVEVAMRALDWKWHSLGAVPELHEIKQFARKLMKDALSHHGNMDCGGFRVTLDEAVGFIQLQFVVDSWDSRN